MLALALAVQFASAQSDIIDLPKTPYSQWMSNLYRNLNQLRGNRDLLRSKIAEEKLRQIDEEVNGRDAGTYWCWDSLDKVKAGDPCDRWGFWDHGNETLTAFEEYLDSWKLEDSETGEEYEKIEAPHALEWSPVMALAA